MHAFSQYDICLLVCTIRSYNNIYHQLYTHMITPVSSNLYRNPSHTLRSVLTPSGALFHELTNSGSNRCTLTRSVLFHWQRHWDGSRTAKRASSLAVYHWRHYAANGQSRATLKVTCFRQPICAVQVPVVSKGWDLLLTQACVRVNPAARTRSTLSNTKLNLIE